MAITKLSTAARVHSLHRLPFQELVETGYPQRKHEVSEVMDLLLTGINFNPGIDK